MEIVCSYVRDKLRKNKTIAQNTGYLMIIECVRLFLPFVALPYIIRTIGAEKYGLVAFAQTITQYFIIIINFGLDISAVRDVAVHRDNGQKLNEIVSTVMTIKLLLFIFSFLLLLIGVRTIPFMFENSRLLSFTFLTCLSELLFPAWFFQGIEKMRYITIVRCSALLFYTVTIFIFIRQQSDYELVALLQSLGNVLAGIIAFYSLLKVEEINLMVPSHKMLWQMFRDAIPFWFSRVSIVFNTNLAKTVSGLVLSMESVAAFDIAQKISQAVLIPNRMLNQAAYPYISRSLNQYFASRFLYLNILVAFLCSTMIFALSPVLIRFFAGDTIPEAVGILRILCLYTFSASISVCLGGCTLVAFGYPRPFNESVILSTFFLCFLYAGLYLTGLVNSYCFAFAIVLTDLFVLTYRIVYCTRYHIFKFGK